MVKSSYASVPIVEDSLSNQLLKRIPYFENRTALVDGKTQHEVSYKNLGINIRQLAISLNKLGLKKGDIVALYAPNSLEYIYCLYAVMINGAATATINPSYTPYELSNAIKLTKAKWWITTTVYIKTLQHAIASSKVQTKAIIVIDSKNDEEGYISFQSLLQSTVPTSIEDFSSIFSNIKINPHTDTAIIMFSSGTTGLPKGVMLTHYNFLAMMTILSRLIGINDPDHKPGEQPVVLVVLPFFHIYGMVGVMMISLFAGHKLVVLPKFQPDVTVFPVVPPLLNYMSKNPSIKERYNLSSLRRMMCGAAPLTEQSEKQFRSIYKFGEIRQGFGMTETCLAVTMMTPDKPIKWGSVGHPLPNCEVVVKSLETGMELGPYERGEICVKAPQNMLGYLNNKQATDETIDKDGWLHTGDIGYFDKEEYFFIIDRIKELIKYKGFQVPPAEIEALLLTHPSVAEAAVIGIPDSSAGELPKAFVVKKNGQEVTAEEIIKFVENKMSYYKHLRGGVAFVPYIPKSESGKILRRQLKETHQSKL